VSLLIFEIGHNGNGNMKLNKLMIEEAKACGADIAKFQLYDTDKIKKPWQSRYLELKFAELSKEEAFELKEHADKVGIEFMASAFDVERVGWLEEMGVKRHKLASRSINDKELIEAMEATGKPIVASLGAWNKEELPIIKNADFLFCISEYPTHITEEQFPHLFGDDQKYQGFSDHTVGTYWAREAFKRGAKIVEKHFTLSTELPGYNQKGSMEPWDGKDLVNYKRQIDRGITF
jgi:sialic acid synthase SpsE